MSDINFGLSQIDAPYNSGRVFIIRFPVFSSVLMIGVDRFACFGTHSMNAACK